MQIEEMLKTEYGLSSSTIQKDIKNAFDKLAEKQEGFTSNVRNIVLERYEFLWNKCIEKQDYKSAAQILKSISDLFGLNINKSEVEVKDGSFVISFE